MDGPRCRFVGAPAQQKRSRGQQGNVNPCHLHSPSNPEQHKADPCSAAEVGPAAAQSIVYTEYPRISTPNTVVRPAAVDLHRARLRPLSSMAGQQDHENLSVLLDSRILSGQTDNRER
jgi:hypothetical protein